MSSHCNVGANRDQISSESPGGCSIMFSKIAMARMKLLHKYVLAGDINKIILFTDGSKILHRKLLKKSR